MTSTPAYSVRVLHVIADAARRALEREEERRVSIYDWHATDATQYAYDLALLHLSLDDRDYELTSAAMRHVEQNTTDTYDRLLAAADACRASDRDERTLVWLYA